MHIGFFFFDTMLLHNTIIQYKHNFYMHWKTKKFMWLSLLWYLHYCSDLYPNLQYHWGRPPPHHLVCACVYFVCAQSGVNLWIAYIFKISHFQWTQWSAFSFLISSSDPHSNIFSWVRTLQMERLHLREIE